MDVSHAIKILKAGDKSGLKYLVYLFSKDFIKIAARYTRDHEEAKDILQDSYIKIYRSIQQLNDNDEISFTKWASRIIINTALRKYSKHYYKNEREQILDYKHPLQEAKIHSKLNSDDIHSLINELPIKYKTVFTLYVIDGYSHKEISELLEINEGTSRSQFLRARKMLQAKLSTNTMISYER